MLSFAPAAVADFGLRIETGVRISAVPDAVRPPWSVEASLDPLGEFLLALDAYRDSLAGPCCVTRDDDGCLFVSVPFSDAGVEEDASMRLADVGMDLLERHGVVIGLASYVIPGRHAE